MADLITPGPRDIIGSKKTKGTEAGQEFERIMNKTITEFKAEFDKMATLINEISEVVNKHTAMFEAVEQQLQVAGTNSGLALTLASSQVDIKDVEVSMNTAQKIQDNLSGYIRDVGPRINEHLQKIGDKLEKEMLKEEKKAQKDAKRVSTD